jgi:hypothetical protein
MLCRNSNNKTSNDSINDSNSNRDNASGIIIGIVACMYERTHEDCCTQRHCIVRANAGKSQIVRDRHYNMIFSIQYTVPVRE